MSALRFGLLGPLEVLRDGRRVPLNTGKLRVFLAALLVQAGRPVSIEELADRLWGQDVPAAARGTIQVYALRLRRALGDDTARTPLISTRPNGYTIEIAPQQLDIAQFRELCDDARTAGLGGDRAGEASRLTEALALWRGRALSDVPSESLQREIVPQLEEDRLRARERRLAVDLELGRHREVISDLVQLTKDHPWQEPFWAQLMLALHRSDRQADALDTYRTVRDRFRAELGIEPGDQLQQLHRSILDGSVLAGSAVSPAVADSRFPVRICQLPPTVRRFVGRDGLTAELSALLTPEGTTGPPVPVVTVSGAPGVGKTALALQVAHRVRPRFPDGQLYLNLRGFAAEPPLPATTALTRFLRALGVPPNQVPSDLDDQSALYRSLLADRRMLVVLDNAAAPEQVRPLLPGQPGCAVLVTSRSDLRGLAATQGVDQVPLGVLTGPESAAVLADLVGAGRAAAEPEAVADLAGACAHLPLALRIAGANLAAEPHGSIAEYTAKFRAQGRLAQLAIDGDEQAAVLAAFDLSYRQLQPADRQLFRLLGAAPGLDFAVPAVVALSGWTPQDIHAGLDRLVAVNLLHQPADGRYQLHDLIREYAGDRAAAEDPAAEVTAAVRLLLDFYVHAADAAARQLCPDTPRLLGPASVDLAQLVVIDSAAAAMRWLDEERANVLAAITYAAGCPEFAQHAWELVDVVRGYVQAGGQPVEGLAFCAATLRAAEQAGDDRARAAVSDLLGLIHFALGDFAKAVTHHSRALEAARRSGDLDAEAACLHHLARVYSQWGQPAPPTAPACPS